MNEPDLLQRVLAALEPHAAAAVLRVATRLAEMTAAGVEAVHVGRSLPAALVELADRAQVELRAIAGPADRALLAELERPEFNAIVMGPGSDRHGYRPLGPTTRYVAERSTKPVVVVPVTGGGEGPERPFRRLLVPLEGSEPSSRTVLETLLPRLVAGVEVEVLHVFTQETQPRMLDDPVRDLETLGREFLAKHFPSASGIVLRSGVVADAVREHCDERGADMVVLSWSQHRTEGSARVVHDVLRSAAVPVMLLPVARDLGPTALPERQAPAAP
ncbi:MAG: universal stress protein [Actinomycetota bacterium]|nr:universal stress protein [Actinomycetota bacterium]